MKEYSFRLVDSRRHGIGNFPWADTKVDTRILVSVEDNRGGYTLYTDNLGDSWQERREGTRPHMVEMPDKTLFGVGFSNVAIGHFDPSKQKKIPYLMKIMRAESMDALLSGDIQVSFAQVEIPDLAVGYGDSQDPKEYHTGVTGQTVIVMPNGDLIVPMYGQFKADTTKLSYFQNYDFYQYRVWCVISRDNGRSFSYLSTVADVQTYPCDPEAEGYCEPDMLHLGNGHLLCVMRTQGHEVYSALYAAHSYDGGITWEPPKEICPYGVLPRLVRLSDGGLLCASGKWGTFFITSSDEGRTWAKPYAVSDNRGQWDRGPSGYVSVWETRPGEILLVWDETEDLESEDIKPGERRIVYMNRYQITADEALLSKESPRPYVSNMQ